VDDAVFDSLDRRLDPAVVKEDDVARFDG